MTTLVELSRKGIYIITLRGLELQPGRLGSQDAQHWIQQWITGLGMPPPLPAGTTEAMHTHKGQELSPALDTDDTTYPHNGFCTVLLCSGC